MVSTAFQVKNDYSNTIWICKIGKSADTLKLMPNNHAVNYDCESNYTYHNTYLISKDTLVIIEKDDSHSEDHGKIAYDRIRMLFKGNKLYPIVRDELINKKWVHAKTQMSKEYVFERIK